MHLIIAFVLSWLLPALHKNGSNPFFKKLDAMRSCRLRQVQFLRCTFKRATSDDGPQGIQQRVVEHKFLL
jgi:hypothetical protein